MNSNLMPFSIAYKVDLRKIKLFFTEILLILACMNFFQQGTLFMIIFVCFVLLTNRVSIKFTPTIIFLFFFSATGFLNSILQGWDFKEIIKPLLCFFSYFAGITLFNNYGNDNKIIKKLIICVFLGFLIEILLDYFYNLMNTVNLSRHYYSVWTGNYISVTLVSLLFSPVVGYSYYGFFVSKNKTDKLLSIIGMVLLFVVNISTATRTPFVLLILVYLVMTLFLFRNKEKKYRIKIFVFISSLTLAIILLFSFNIFGLRDAFFNTELYSRFNSTGINTSRIEIFLKYLQNFKLSIFGGRNISEYVGIEAHNFVQQIGDWYGVVPLLFILLYTASVIKTIIKTGMNKHKDGEDILIVSLLLSMLVQCLLEPVISGYPMLLWALIFTHSALVYKISSKNINRKI